MLRVQVFTDDAWSTIAHARRDGLSGSLRVADSTTKDSPWWTEALGIDRSLTIECEAIAATPAAYRAAMAAISGDGIHAQIIDGEEVLASFRAAVSLDLSGDYDGVAGVAIVFKSISPPSDMSPTIAVDGDLYRVGEWSSGQSGAVFVAPTEHLPAFTVGA